MNQKKQVSKAQKLARGGGDALSEHPRTAATDTARRGRPLTEQEHEALELLDAIEAILRLSTWTIGTAESLHQAITKTEDAMRAAR